MSIFASQVQRTLAIPHDEPHTVTIQKLSGKKLERAAKNRTAAMFADMQQMGGAQFLKELQALATDEDALKKAAAAAKEDSDGYEAYDRDALIAGGVVAWTYQTPLCQESLEDLDEDTREFIARAVFDLSKRRSAADRKNG